MNALVFCQFLHMCFIHAVGLCTLKVLHISAEHNFWDISSKDPCFKTKKVALATWAAKCIYFPVYLIKYQKLKKTLKNWKGIAANVCLVYDSSVMATAFSLHTTNLGLPVDSLGSRVSTMELPSGVTPINPTCCSSERDSSIFSSIWKAGTASPSV